MRDVADKLSDGYVCSPAQNYCRNNAVMLEAEFEISMLRQALVRYGDRARMSNAPPDLQHAIDRAFQNNVKETSE